MVRLYPYTTAILGNYKKATSLYYGEFNNKVRICRVNGTEAGPTPSTIIYIKKIKYTTATTTTTTTTRTERGVP